MAICERCQKEHDGTFGSGRFCNRKCANTRIHSEETKQKISLSVSRSVLRNVSNHCKIYYILCNFCNVLKIKKYPGKYCNISCATSQQNLNGHASNMGKISAAKRVKRSKNEIYFAELCKERFQNVLTNTQMFNGWDADVIIEDLKIAILWNGPWHYKDGLGKNHSLKQVRNRDKIKIREIAKAGYKPLVIKDDSEKNNGEEFVIERFNKFLKRFL